VAVAAVRVRAGVDADDADDVKRLGRSEARQRSVIAQAPPPLLKDLALGSQTIALIFSCGQCRGSFRCDATGTSTTWKSAVSNSNPFAQNERSRSNLLLTLTARTMKCAPSLLLLGLLLQLRCEARVAWARQELPDGLLFHEDNERARSGVLLVGPADTAALPHAWRTKRREDAQMGSPLLPAAAITFSEVEKQGNDARVIGVTEDAGARGQGRVSESTDGQQVSRLTRTLSDVAASGGGGGEGNGTTQNPSNSEISVQNETASGDAINCTFGEELPLKHGFYSLKHIVNPLEGTITVEFTFQEVGWVSFGTNPNGKMIGGEVVIAKPNEPASSTNPGKYSMSGQSADAVTLMDAQTLLNASWTQGNGTTVLRYTKLLKEEGEIEIFPDGSNTFIFAAGMGNDFADHGLRFGKVKLSSLAQCAVPGQSGENANPMSSNAASDASDSDSATASLWALHGILMGAAWAILVPIAVGCSLVRSILPVRPGWFQLHMGANTAAFLLQTAAFGVAVYMTSQDNEGHFQGTHKSVGLAVYLVSFVQVLSGFFRPPLSRPGPPVKFREASDEDNNDHGEQSFPQEGPSNNSAQLAVGEGGRRGAEPESLGSSKGYAGVGAEDDDTQELPAPRKNPKKRASRLAFEVGHRVVGFGLVGLAWYNCSTGIDAMVAHYGEFYDNTTVLWGVVGTLSGLIALLYAYQMFCWKGSSRQGAIDEGIPCVQRS
jgi:Eukaryotic cytochrome b561